jgi:AGCS family alanine or glycine:cation symporter
MKEENRRKVVKAFKVVYIVLIAVSSTIKSGLIWAIDDTFNGLMAVPNLICLLALQSLVAKITKNYFDRKKGLDVKPMLSAYPDMNEQSIQDIQSSNEGMH